MKLTIEISDTTADEIGTLLRGLGDGDANTHGKLTIEKLAEMLMEDVAMVQCRPGSWEGNNMAQVLTSHGYEP